MSDTTIQSTANIFENLNDYKVSQDFTATGKTKKVITSLTCDKPNKLTFFQVHPSYQLQAGVVNVPGDGLHIVKTDLMAELRGDAQPHLLIPAITREGKLFIWPVKLPDPFGRPNRWSETALEAVAESRSNWIRLVANMQDGQYDVIVPESVIPAPEWPDMPFSEMLSLAFKARIIDRPDHPAILKLRGAL